MADKVYPSAKLATAAYGGAKPSFPATKAQLYATTGPAFHPQAYHHHRRGSTFCFWFLLVILILLLLIISVSGTIIYLFYRPQSPSLTVISFKLSYLNMTSSFAFNSKFELNINATNPNKKVTFQFDPISIFIISGEVNIGHRRLPSFNHGKKNTTLLRALILSNGVVLDGESTSQLKVSLDTKVKAKMGRLKIPKVGLGVFVKESWQLFQPPGRNRGHQRLLA